MIERLKTYSNSTEREEEEKWWLKYVEFFCVHNNL